MITTADAIQRYIETTLPCEFITVTGDGHHFEAIIVSDIFEGLNRIQQHQRVYQALGDRMREEIHALSIKTYTSTAWQQLNSQC